MQSLSDLDWLQVSTQREARLRDRVDALEGQLSLVRVKLQATVRDKCVLETQLKQKTEQLPAALKSTRTDQTVNALMIKLEQTETTLFTASTESNRLKVDKDVAVREQEDAAAAARRTEASLIDRVSEVERQHATKAEAVFDEQQDHQETRRRAREREIQQIGQLEASKQELMQQQMREQAKVSALERGNRCAACV